MSPNTPHIPPDAPRLIEVLAFPNVQILDVTGPMQTFVSANERAAEGGAPAPYIVRIVAPGGRPVRASAGLSFETEPLPDAHTPLDTLIVAGGHGVMEAAGDAGLVAWVRTRASVARRVASVCTGAFLLGATGLLDGRQAATHWAYCDLLAARHPSIRVERDPIFVTDGQMWTSAGVTAGIDLSLALVEADLGHDVAVRVAHHLVVFLKRPGGQTQFSTMLTLQSSDTRFADLHDWIAVHLSNDLSLAHLAARSGMSERSFLRHYQAATGTTPGRSVERLRVEAARHLLCGTRMSIKRIAAQCGFGSEETMRRSFVRVQGVGPQDYRAKFGPA